MATAAVDSFGLELDLGPDFGGVAGGFVVAVDTGIELAAASVLDGDDVALGMVVGALGALVHVGTMNNWQFGKRGMQHNFLTL